LGGTGFCEKGRIEKPRRKKRDGEQGSGLMLKDQDNYSRWLIKRGKKKKRSLTKKKAMGKVETKKSGGKKEGTDRWSVFRKRFYRVATTAWLEKRGSKWEDERREWQDETKRGKRGGREGGNVDSFGVSLIGIQSPRTSCVAK